ncbi:acyltransferase family protein [Methylobacterium sp. CM6247]
MRIEKMAVEQPGRNNFDYIRLFAATQVVIFHVLHHLQLEAPAWTTLFAPFSGVPIFFVVSGFLITSSYERSSSIGSYIEKRARRIMPGLWLCLIVTSALLLSLGYPLLSLQGATWFFSQLGGLIYTPVFLQSFGFGSYNGSLWTIPVELQFYATVPLLSFMIHRTRNKSICLVVLLIICVFIAIAIRIWVPSIIKEQESPELFFEKIWRYLFITHYFQFLLGAVAYYLFPKVKNLLCGRAIYWLALVVLMYNVLPYSAFTVVLSQAALGVLTLSTAYTWVRVSWLHGYDISYGVYLFHGLIVNILVVAGFTMSFYWLYFVLLASYAIGFVSWTLVESKFVKRIKRSV